MTSDADDAVGPEGAQGADELAGLVLPDGLEHVRTTPQFTAESVPAGLRAALPVAPGVWGVLVVAQGHVDFVMEASGATRRVGAGERQVIPPQQEHHVEPGPDARFAVQFHRDPTYLQR